MELQKREQGPAPEGCLTVAIRIPVRIVVLVVAVPVRMVWDLLVVCGRTVQRVLLRPLGNLIAAFWEHLLAPAGRAVGAASWWLVRAVFYWPWIGLWRQVVVPVASAAYRYVLAPVGRGLAWVCARVLVPFGRGVVVVLWAVLVWPLTALWGYVLAPVGRGLAWVCARVLVPFGRGVVVVLWAVLVWPWTALWRYVLTPVGRGIVWLVVVPARFLHRWVFTPVGRFLVVVGREVADAFQVAWRVAGYVSRAVGRAMKWLVRNLLGRPLAWFYRTVCTPIGHFVRDQLWAPTRRAVAEAGRAVRGALVAARETVRQVRRDAWRALVGGPRAPEPVGPAPVRARNLGGTQHTQTVPEVAPGPEISPQKRG